MFDRVIIVGVGLLGASLGLALKDRSLARHVVGVGRRQASLDIALARKAIDSANTDLTAAVKGGGGADLVILCTPVRQFRKMLQELAPALQGTSTIVTDVGSTKAQVMQWAAEILRNTSTDQAPIFIGSHPMAGSEKRGPEYGRPDLYEGSLCLLCTPLDFDAPQNTAATSPTLQAFEKVQTLWRNLGMRTLWLPAKEHDRWVATISHLPHAVAFSLVNAAAREPQMLQAVAGGFIDTTRVASSDLEMWTDIFLTNREAIVQAIDTFSADLQHLKAAIAAGNEAAIRDALAAAKKTRDELLEQRKKNAMAISYLGRVEPPASVDPEE